MTRASQIEEAMCIMDLAYEILDPLIDSDTRLDFDALINRLEALKCSPMQ